MTRALVTGITGQTGSYLCDELTADGWEVHGLVRDGDDLEAGLSSRHADVEVHHGDLADADSVLRVLDRVRPDVVFNLGGLSSVRDSWDRPIDFARVTGLGPAAVLAAARRVQDDAGSPITVVQASSAEIFGTARVAPQDENTPLNPSNPYGAAKAYGHLLTGAYRHAGLPAVSAILYNHESPRRPTGFVSRKISSTVAAIAAGRATELVLGNLDARRDWGWAPDYAHALRLLGENPVGDVVIATGESHSVRDFVEVAFASAGIDDWRRFVRFDESLTRTGDVAEMVGNPARAESLLGWRRTHDFSAVVGAMVEHDRALLGRS